MATYAGRYDEVLLRKAGNRLAPPAANTTVLVYESDGSTTAALYTDRTKATTAANPVTVDASGNLEFFAEPGTYVLSIRESGSQVATNTVTVLNDPAESTGGGATNLTWTPSTSTVASDTGTDAVLTAVDASNPGLMTVAQSNKLAGIETAATADQTAAEILTAIKTVDGTSSGLDADLLRGTTPSAFGLTVLDDADAATARTTLGAEATLNAAGVVAKFTGTPDGTKFLRDDGTLAAAAGGGGTSPIVPLNKTYLREGLPGVAADYSSTVTLSQGWLFVYPFVLTESLTVNSIKAASNGTNAGASMLAQLYSCSSYASGSTLSAITGTSVTLDVSTGGTKTGLFGSGVALSAGYYAVGLVVTGANAVMWGFAPELGGSAFYGHDIGAGTGAGNQRFGVVPSTGHTSLPASFAMNASAGASVILLVPSIGVS